MIPSKGISTAARAAIRRGCRWDIFLFDGWVSVSAWLSEAAADRLRNELLGVALDTWESEDGSFTEAELDTAASRLGLAPRPDVA